jgi:hypothetical protein
MRIAPLAAACVVACALAERAAPQSLPRSYAELAERAAVAKRVLRLRARRDAFADRYAAVLDGGGGSVRTDDAREAKREIDAALWLVSQDLTWNPGSTIALDRAEANLRRAECVFADRLLPLLAKGRADEARRAAAPR